jgi:hypothetical protein
VKGNTKDQTNGDGIDRATLVEYWHTHRDIGIIQNHFEEGDLHGMRIEEVRVKAPKTVGADYMAVIKVSDTSGGRWVAFRYGHSLRELNARIAADLEGEGLNLKEDRLDGHWVKNEG